MGKIVLKPTALIVEDENITRMETVDIFADAGFEVIEAWTGDMALRLLENSPHIEIVFTDVRMPGRVDGIHLAQLIAQRWPEIAVMVCSGPVTFRPRALPDKARFFPKPFSLSEVSATARALVA
jgi:DNA-binding NtrC family response regulator